MKRWIILPLLLSACAEDAPPSMTEVIEPAGPPDVVVPSTGMDAGVAALINEGWTTLNDALASTEVTNAERAEAYATFGLLCFGNGLTPTAEAAFENAIHWAPDDARWIYFLALVHQFTGELGAAGDGFETVLSLNPEQWAAAVRLGDVRYEQARFDAATAAYQSAATQADYRAAANYGLGRVADANGDYAAAISHYEIALAEQPNANRINYLLGLAWRNEGDLDKAQALLADHGSAEPAFPDPLFDEISGGRAQIGGLWANMNAGSQAFVDGDYAQAVENFQQATVDHPDDPRSWESLGMALRRTGELNEAEAAYRRAVVLSPDNGELAVTHAEISVELGNNEQALEDLQSAATHNANDATVRMALGMMYSQTGNHTAAVTEIQAAIAAAENDDIVARAQYSLGRAHTANGDTALAAQAFAAALEANPDHGGAQLELARTQARARQFVEALDHYVTYLSRFPRNDGARIEAATTAIFLNDVQTARALMEEGVSTGEASPRQLSSLARFLVLITDPEIRNPQSALQYANTALQATGTRQHAETLALCLAALGQFEDAVRIQNEILADAQQLGDTAAAERAARNLQAYQQRSLGRLPLDAN